MSTQNNPNLNISNDTWPPFSYPPSKSTLHLLHRAVQMMGKLKLTTPFEPHWANVCLWPTSRGLTTGVIPYKSEVLSVNLDCIEHKMIFSLSSGKMTEFKLKSGNVSTLFQTFLQQLQLLDINVVINPNPQEIPNAVSFLEDSTEQQYDPNLATSWWRILINSYRVLEQYHARFNGISPSVGFMWGTFDLRDARYLNIPVDTSKLGYIERNAMDVQQIEAGWWAGNEMYPKPAYYAFTYPKPSGIEEIKIQPEGAAWNATLGEFILDYDVVRNSPTPEAMLLQFFESAYQVGSKLAGWDPKLITSGKPI